MASLLSTYPGLRFYWPDIHAAATAHGFDPFLIAAIVVQESAANADGFRHERLFWNRYLKLKDEWRLKNPRRVSSSYGLMQVMYPVAVERGYDPDAAPEGLFVPAVSLEFGCRQLDYMRRKIRANFPSASEDERLKATLASYNGGYQGPHALRPDNRRYAESVLRHYTQLRADAQA